MSAFSPRQMFLLDHACKPIVEAFGEHPYLVGTALNASAGGRGEYRDVDVRLILTEKRYERLRKLGPDVISFLGLAIGQYLAAQTGLPIDFQIQRQDVANALHQGSRNPLGIRHLANFRGDAHPDQLPKTEAPTTEETP